jgi:nucleotide-binding universal stress UspA family protein
MKILIAVDGSSHTRQMLAYLAAHDEWLGGHQEYVVLNVAVPVPARAASALGREAVDAYYEDESEKIFKPIRTFLKKQGLNAQFISKVGSPAEVISKTAKSGKFDLVMLGSRGHGALVSALLGSVLTKVLAHCEVPVLVVR